MWYDFCELCVIIVLVSSTRFCTEEFLEDILRLFFQEAIWALAPEAVLNRCRDSVKLGPDSMEDSMMGLMESLVLLAAESLWDLVESLWDLVESAE